MYGSCVIICTSYILATVLMYPKISQKYFWTFCGFEASIHNEILKKCMHIYIIVTFAYYSMCSLSHCRKMSGEAFKVGTLC